LAAAPAQPLDESALLINEIGDDRDQLHGGDRVLLIVDNDENFTRFLLDLAREHGFKGIVTPSGAAAVALARDYRPNAITLDIRLPDIDGWTVLNRLQGDLSVRHIPVHIISTDEDCERGLGLGARSVLAKPIKSKEVLDAAFAAFHRDLDRRQQQLVVVARDADQQRLVVDLLALDDLDITVVESAGQALAALGDSRIDGVVVAEAGDAGAGLAVVEQLATAAPTLPIILYSAPTRSKREETQLRRLLGSARLKEVQSPERVLDETLFMLHRSIDQLPPASRATIAALYDNDTVLAGRKVLVVDDDIRNIFALTSVLEQAQITVVPAETGKAAIELLQQTADIDAVLMDIMMPGMDGYETMRAIRRMAKFRHLPIIAVTAKAMKGDREKTIEAGAWDYLSKPVDSAQMLGVLRAWLRR
jgi:CheY-like chemotaxis protein